MICAVGLIQPLQGWALLCLTQGRRCCVNPGLSDHNPFRVADKRSPATTPPLGQGTPYAAEAFLTSRRGGIVSGIYRRLLVRFAHPDNKLSGPPKLCRAIVLFRRLPEQLVYV
jgi:hypothetical protein